MLQKAINKNMQKITMKNTLLLQATVTRNYHYINISCLLFVYIFSTGLLNNQIHVFVCLLTVSVKKKQTKNSQVLASALGPYQHCGKSNCAANIGFCHRGEDVTAVYVCDRYYCARVSSTCPYPNTIPL